MKVFRSIAVVVILGAVLIGLLQMDRVAALFGSQSAVLNHIIYALIGLALVIVVIASLNNDLLTNILGRIGRSSGTERGAEPGDGAVIHNSSGEADFDGLPGDVLPPIRDSERDQPSPSKRSSN
jgi:uncharacterized membrane protein YuzA (DUF378 family)